MNPLLSSACWPNLHYFFYVLQPGAVCIEQFDHYQKQSFRNRTRVLTANGVMDLSIPVHKKAIKEYTKDIEISYVEKWQHRHWKAITSAYSNSPYFEYFEEDVKVFYTERYEKLLDYNMAQLNLILKILKQKKEIVLTGQFEKEPSNLFDMRELIHPKIDHRNDKNVVEVLSKPYYQTFETKFGFTPNLSILDLLFNKGIEAVDYLTGV
jgi:hypothetical protein